VLLNNKALQVSQSQGSQSQAIPQGLKKSQGKVETMLINRVRRSKKSLVIAEISKLEGNNTTIEMYDIIVKQRGLCSKASFYRYMESLRSQVLDPLKLENETPFKV